MKSPLFINGLDNHDAAFLLVWGIKPGTAGLKNETVCALHTSGEA
jgi:hypothetical protein